MSDIERSCRRHPWWSGMSNDCRFCRADPVSRVQAIEAAEDHADQVAFDAWRERGQ